MVCGLFIWGVWCLGVRFDCLLLIVGGKVVVRLILLLDCCEMVCLGLLISSFLCLD